MAKRLVRKVARLGKHAAQFRFTSTLEYIDVSCYGNWRPELLRVIWLRSHRRVESQKVQWLVKDDQGPNGAVGRAVFDPPIAISLLVTLYKQHNHFENKEYKYFIENDGSGGRKILASFTANLAEYAGEPTSRQTLDMNLEPLSKKVSRAVLGLTIESELLKQGSPDDDDMQSTYSAVSIGGGSLQFDDDDEDEVNEAEATSAGTRRQSSACESSPKWESSQSKTSKKPSLNPFDEPSTNPFGGQTPPQTGTGHSRTSPVLINSASTHPKKQQQNHRTSVAATSTVESNHIASKLDRFQQNREAELLQRIKEKDQTIVNLREENKSLQEAIRTLKTKLQTQEEHRHQQEKERQFKEHELRGWLYKRGVKGLTANVWRRRYFRLDQGDKMHYYKSEADLTSKGFIDLKKVMDVSEVSVSQQDKNNTTFHVQCDDRTYQLLAMNTQEMRKWIAAISYLRDFYTSPRSS